MGDMEDGRNLNTGDASWASKEPAWWAFSYCSKCLGVKQPDKVVLKVSQIYQFIGAILCKGKPLGNHKQLSCWSRGGGVSSDKFWCLPFQPVVGSNSWWNILNDTCKKIIYHNFMNHEIFIDDAWWLEFALHSKDICIRIFQSDDGSSTKTDTSQNLFSELDTVSMIAMINKDNHDHHDNCDKPT